VCNQIHGLVQPPDKQLLLQGFGRLSSGRATSVSWEYGMLNEAEPRHLCEVDGTNHFAMGAVVRNADESAVGAAQSRKQEFRDMLAGLPTLEMSSHTVLARRCT